MTAIDVAIRDGEALLSGSLTSIDGSQGVVVFAHGSGSGRHSPRNQAVADVLHGAGLSTLLMDLLTTGEEEVDLATREHRFDIELLGRRVVAAVDWLATQDSVASGRVGVFGASTGAAAALVAAAERDIGAVVSRGGRPDLAGDALEKVAAPTLLIVGGLDDVVLALNERARERLLGPNELVVVPGATHLFEEPGALERVSDLAREWFVRHL